MLGSNQRPLPCRGSALPAELIVREAPIVASADASVGLDSPPMRWRVPSLLTGALAVLAAPAAAVGMSTPMGASTATVSPASIGPLTAVTVSFRQPVTTGLLPGTRVSEALRVDGPARSGCISSGGVALAPRPSGTLMRRRLRPARMHGGRWCLGVYQGSVTVSVFPVCTPGPVRACPMYVIAPRTIVTFRFRVTAR
jgi:hypothetical protein